MLGDVVSKSEQFVRFLFEKSLDKRLHYHNLNHTIQVVKQTARLAQLEKLPTEDTQLLLIAAWFHDSGYTTTYVDHEKESARIATEFLTPLLAPDQITKIINGILSTQKGVIPVDVFQCILHDADYYHFFEHDYFSLIDNLRLEIAEVLLKTFTHHQWYTFNTRFLQQHTFYTTDWKNHWPQQKESLLRQNNSLLHSKGI